MSWPIELRFKRQSRHLDIQFEGLPVQSISYKILRTNSPSAAHKNAVKSGQSPVIDEDIDILAATPVGRYAVRLEFSDGHKTGIYSWDLLRTLSSQ